MAIIATASRVGASRMAPAVVSSASARTVARRTYATPGVNPGPSKVETQPQGSDHRGKTTTYILPAVAAALAIGAFTWLLSSGDKATAVGVGVNNEGGPDKLKSGAARRVEEKLSGGK